MLLLSVLMVSPVQPLLQYDAALHDRVRVRDPLPQPVLQPLQVDQAAHVPATAVCVCVCIYVYVCMCVFVCACVCVRESMSESTEK